MDDATLQQTTTDEQLEHVKGVIESLLFVNERPVALDQIKKVLETVGTADIKKAVRSLREDEEKRKSGIMIVEIAGGYQMLSNPVYASYLRSFYKTKHKEKLSKPALESLAIIAYKQPVTRSDIELVRGVNSDGVVAHLVSKELIKIIGRKDVPGRPYVYGTTKQFLEYFGLKSLDDLPALEEFPTLEPAAEGDIIVLEDGETPNEEVLSAEGTVPLNENEEEAEPAAEEKTVEAEEEAEISDEPVEDSTQELQEQDLSNEPEESTQKN